MPETDCPQIQKLADREIASLCMTCTHRVGCSDAVTSELIEQLAPPGVRRIYIVAQCDGYDDDPKAQDAPTNGDLGPQLFQAGVTDRCCSCPSARKSGCATRYGLDRISQASIARGGWVRSQVVCCDMSGLLHQIRPVAGIAEPAAEEPSPTPAP